MEQKVASSSTKAAWSQLHLRLVRQYMSEVIAFAGL
jgi:hypothetical protein